MAHAGNTKIWAKIIFCVWEEVQHNRVFVAEGRRGGGKVKNASIYALSGHERIEKRSDQ